MRKSCRSSYNLSFVIQTSHASSSSPRQHTESSAASLLLACQESTSKPIQPAGEMQQANGQQPLVRARPYNQLSAPEAQSQAAPSRQPLMLQQSQRETDPAPHAAAIQVKEESGRAYDAEDACMDTHLAEEEGAEPCGQEGEELDIYFDSQFPDLIADLITEEANPITAQPANVPNMAVFPAGVRYMVPPQPSPSSSYLPFPHLLPSTSSRLASITDFSPDWSYPEVTNRQLLCL